MVREGIDGGTPDDGFLIGIKLADHGILTYQHIPQPVRGVHTHLHVSTCKKMRNVKK